MDLKTVVSRVAKSKAFKVVAAVTAVLFASFLAPGGASRLLWFKDLADYRLPVLKAALDVFAGPAAQSLGLRVLTRVIDWGVPVAVVVFGVAMASDDGEDSPEDMGEEKLLKKLLKGGGSKKAGPAPSKEFIRIESLGDKP